MRKFHTSIGPALLCTALLLTGCTQQASSAGAESAASVTATPDSAAAAEGTCRMPVERTSPPFQKLLGRAVGGCPHAAASPGFRSPDSMVRRDSGAFVLRNFRLRNSPVRSFSVPFTFLRLRCLRSPLTRSPVLFRPIRRRAEPDGFQSGRWRASPIITAAPFTGPLIAS